MHHDQHHSSSMRASGGGAATASPGGFTLVELLVAVVIILVLSSLMLSGMAVARSRAKIDRTRTTIRKIHEIVMPQYESYVRRRVPLPPGLTSGSAIASERLQRIRTLSLYEMPDSWADVANSGTDARAGDGANAVGAGVITIPAYAWTGVARSYGAFRIATGSSGFAANGSAECLYLVVSRGTQEPDVMEQFRGDEIGDIDNDGAPEFLDAWNRPIMFLRWAPGFSSPLSPVQVADPVNFHDPLDPLRRDAAGYALVPLVVSAGPDGALGIQPSTGWSTLNLAQVVVSGSGFGQLSPPATTAHLDNITNHDLIKK